MNYTRRAPRPQNRPGDRRTVQLAVPSPIVGGYLGSVVGFTFCTVNWPASRRVGTTLGTCFLGFFASRLPLSRFPMRARLPQLHTHSQRNQRATGNSRYIVFREGTALAVPNSARNLGVLTREVGLLEAARQPGSLLKPYRRTIHSAQRPVGGAGLSKPAAICCNRSRSVSPNRENTSLVASFNRSSAFAAILAITSRD